MFRVIHRVYQVTIPTPVRSQAWRARRQTKRAIHNCCWHVVPAQLIERWVAERLNLGESTWLFVLGCNNSGTTLLSQVLGAHPLVRSLPKEGQRLTNALPFPPDYGLGRLFTKRMDVFRWTEETQGIDVQRIRYDWAAHCVPGRGLLLEKSPPNTLRSRWLQVHFEPSRFLILVRHPYAVCEGIRRRRVYSIEAAAQHWRQVHATLREDMPFLKQVMVVRYEDLCESPLEQLRKLEAFAGLSSWFDDDVVRRNFTVHNIDGSPETIQNFNVKSFVRLSSHDVATINGIVATEMKDMGYEPLDPSEFGQNSWNIRTRLNEA